MPHVVESRVLFGAADGSEGFYTPCTLRTRLRTLARGYRRGTTRTQAVYGQNFAHVPATSPNVTTPLQIILNINEIYMSHIQDLVGELNQYIGGSNADQPKDLWYQDDALLVITATNAETAVSGLVTVEYTGTADHLSAGDFIYYPSGTTIVPNEVTVIESINHTAGTFTAALEQNHLADVEISKINWCYPNARLDSIITPTASTGRGQVVINMTSEGLPLSGDSLP